MFVTVRADQPMRHDIIDGLHQGAFVGLHRSETIEQEVVRNPRFGRKSSLEEKSLANEFCEALAQQLSSASVIDQQTNPHPDLNRGSRVLGVGDQTFAMECIVAV